MNRSMSHPSRKVPSYSQHKASGQAVVRLAGVDKYLGIYGSPESHEKYQRYIAEWRASQCVVAPADASSRSKQAELLTIAELCLRYRAFAESYYVADGKPTKEFVNLKYAMRPLRELYGSTMAMTKPSAKCAARLSKTAAPTDKN